MGVWIDLCKNKSTYLFTIVVFAALTAFTTLIAITVIFIYSI
ncbi:hypothetical protein [Terrisporobacter sp.]